MSEIDQLESRLSAALGRIGDALARLPQAPAGPDPQIALLQDELDRQRRTVETLRAERTALESRLDQKSEALEAETLVARQLEARNAALRDKLAERDSTLAETRAALAGQDALVAQFRRVNAQLRENNRALREANAKGLADVHLINKAMLIELESIRASREAERAEIDAVLADLEPLVGEAADA